MYWGDQPNISCSGIHLSHLHCQHQDEDCLWGSSKHMVATPCWLVGDALNHKHQFLKTFFGFGFFCNPGLRIETAFAWEGGTVIAATTSSPLLCHSTISPQCASLSIIRSYLNCHLHPIGRSTLTTWNCSSFISNYPPSQMYKSFDVMILQSGFMCRLVSISNVQTMLLSNSPIGQRARLYVFFWTKIFARFLLSVGVDQFESRWPPLPPPRWRMGGKTATAGFCPKITAHVRAPCQLGASKWTSHLEGKGEKWWGKMEELLCGQHKVLYIWNQAIPDTIELRSNHSFFSLRHIWENYHNMNVDFAGIYPLERSKEVVRSVLSLLRGARLGHGRSCTDCDGKTIVSFLTADFLKKKISSNFVQKHKFL